MTSLTGFGRIVRFTLRRDRVRIAIWVIGLCIMIVSSGASLLDVYPDQAAIDSYVELFGDNPALIAFAGPGYGFDEPNLGVVLVNETQVFGAVAMALMSIFLLNRQTRVEEENERIDLLRSNVVGRHAPTAASMLVVSGANLVVGAVAAVAFIALGYDTAGSIALAGSLAAVGLLFAGITAVAAQLAGTGRGTLGLSTAALGVAFVVRAAGDIAGNGLSWFSPIGWAQAVRAFADERWWTLGLCVAVTGGLLVGAFWLSARRDLGSGILAAKPGAPNAAGWMTRPIGFAWRLQRGALIGWIVGLFITGAVYGSIGEDVDEMVEENPVMADFLAQLDGASITDSFFSTSAMMLALIASGFAISSALVPRSEETSGRAESIVARPVHRHTWVGSHLAISVVGTTIIMAAAGLGVGVSYAMVSSDSSQVLRLVGAGVVTVPAVLVLIGASIALFGLLPRFALAAWGLLAGVAVIGFFGELLQLPGWTRQLSPFEHLPAVPAEELAVLPLVVMTVLAGALMVVGLLAVRNRDLALQ